MHLRGSDSGGTQTMETPQTKRLPLWGKLKKDDDGNIQDWLPLADHCTDVASVFHALCKQRAILRTLSIAIGREPTSSDIDRLSVLAFLHDLGKCNRGFQAKALRNPQRVAGHVREIAPLLYDAELSERFLAAIDYDATLVHWCDGEEGTLRMLLASVSHHGKPIELDDIHVHAQRSLWTSGEDRDPIGDIASLMAQARDLFPGAFSPSAPPLTASAALQHRFAGLVMLADWLGSHAEGFFPFHADDRPRAEFAREAAEHALAAVGLNVEATRAAANPGTGFTALFGFTPTPLQQRLFELQESRLFIAESDTGSGKTEAALGHFFQLFAAGQVDSLYFALPTRVAARELYERVRGFAQRAFGEDAPPVLLAVPGYARVDGAALNRVFPGTENLWQDDASVRRRERAWAAERPKRFLAAPVAVGTIDQALLSTMQVNHAHLRCVCLERSLLVVDEVHASDTYMRGLLRALLDHHRRAGGHALLLSATLGCSARAELLAPPGSAAAIPALAAASDQPYPALTDDQGRLSALPRASRASKHVGLQPVAQITSPTELVPNLAEALAQGAHVLVVLNTVNRVIELLRACEQHPGVAPHLFRVGGHICPHHGRFARADRLLLDAAASAALGKNRSDDPVLLIGSQTLEQSLDIDADWLITDLCPMDVLLQRIGRLHRHDRPRPAGFERARCTVLVPEDPALENLFDNRGNVPRGLAGLGKVYPDLRIARLTLERIANGCEITIPEDNRALVEWATHPENLARFDRFPWTAHSNNLLATDVAHGQAANSALIQESLSFGDDELRFHALGERLSTRLGLDDRRIPLAEPVKSPFGQTLFDLPIPGWMARGIEADTLDAPPETDGATLIFSYGGKAFCYSRLGLEFADER